MHYDQDGHVLDFEYTDELATLRRCRTQRDLAMAQSVGLNTYLATAGAMRHIA